MWTDYQIETNTGDKISIERDEMNGADDVNYRIHIQINSGKWYNIILDESELKHFMKLCKRSLNDD